MKKLSFLLFALTLLLPLSLRAQTQIAPEKRAEIKKFIELSNTKASMIEGMAQMIEIQKKSPSSANLSPEFFDKFYQKVTTDIDALIDQLIFIYDKYYTIEDLRAINAFYASPVGQKTVATLPLVMKESMKAGQAWGIRTAMSVMNEILQAEHPLPTQTPAPWPDTTPASSPTP